MKKSKSFDKNSQILDSEYLYRVVLFGKFFWKQRYSTPSSVIYSDEKGVSVQRDGDREETSVIHFFISKKFNGYLAKLNAGKCREIGAYPIPKPSKNSDYHSEIHNSPSVIPISDDKREELAKNTQVVCKL